MTTVRPERVCANCIFTLTLTLSLTHRGRGDWMAEADGFSAQGRGGYKTRPYKWRFLLFRLGLLLGFRPWGLGLVGERQGSRIVVSIRPGVRNYLDGSSVGSGRFGCVPTRGPERSR